MASALHHSMSSLTFDPPAAAEERRHAAVAPAYLDWTQRPGELQERISRAFLNISQDDTSDWGLSNGVADYNLCGIKEYFLMKKIIQQAPPEQRDFYALDIGAGNFQWGDGLATFIDAQADLPEGIKIHIIGIRGEQFNGDRLVQTDRYNVYKLGAFKIEELAAQFQEQRLELTNRVHLIVSNWAFRHFADPVGTFQQTMNLLCPGGFLLTDGFYFLTQNQNLDDMRSQCFNKNMTQLVIDTRAIFLTREHTVGNSLNHFILQRMDALPCQLSMSYQHILPGRRYDIGSRCITQFIRKQPNDSETLRLPPYKSLSGNKRLHEWLKQNNLFALHQVVPWNPIQKEDEHQMNPRLHEAVARGDIEGVIACLKSEDDIDESDFKGRTALQLAIQHQNEEIFQLLLKEKPNLDLQDEDNRTPLHVAAMMDTDGRFLQPLLDAGAKIDGSGELINPLYLAVKANNLKAMELLLKAGAKISGQNRFTPLHVAAEVDTDGRSLQLLLDAGSKIDGSGEIKNPLYHAIKAKNVVAVELLLKAGAKVSDEHRLKLKDPVFGSFDSNNQ